MGPNSKKAVIKALGALTDGVRSLEAMQASNERLMREVLGRLGVVCDRLESLSDKIGETVSSHEKANTSIIELRRDTAELEMRLDALLDRRAADAE